MIGGCLHARDLDDLPPDMLDAFPAPRTAADISDIYCSCLSGAAEARAAGADDETVSMMLTMTEFYTAWALLHGPAAGEA